MGNDRTSISEQHKRFRWRFLLLGWWQWYAAMESQLADMDTEREMVAVLRKAETLRRFPVLRAFFRPMNRPQQRIACFLCFVDVFADL